MDELKVRIDRAARAYNEAAAALAVLLVEQVNAQDPVLAAKIEQALGEGARLLLAMEMSPLDVSIWLATIDDYRQMRRIVTIPTKPAQLAN